MARRKKSSRSRAVPATPGSIARSARGTLRSYTVGALPIIDHILKRMKLEEFLQDYLPKEHRRSKIAAARGSPPWTCCTPTNVSHGSKDGSNN